MSEKDSEREGRGFTIVDRRHGRDEGGSEGAEPPGTQEPEAGAADAGSALPAVDFSTFVLSLSTSALYHMGLVVEREGEAPPEPNLPMARQTIDILEMLEAKTRGNLESEEARLLENLLYELRMRFVEVNK